MRQVLGTPMAQKGALGGILWGWYLEFLLLLLRLGGSKERGGDRLSGGLPFCQRRTLATLRVALLLERVLATG